MTGNQIELCTDNANHIRSQSGFFAVTVVRLSAQGGKVVFNISEPTENISISKNSNVSSIFEWDYLHLCTKCPQFVIGALGGESCCMVITFLVLK